jgi:L-2-amino-thiazoline-4-carboxylic acid hydrolase
MKYKEVRIAIPVLSKEIGWSWPIFLFVILSRKNDIFIKTHWHRVKGAESNFMKRLPIISAMYLELINRYNKEKALEIMKKVIVPIGLNESMTEFRSLHISEENQIKLLMRYLDLVDETGAGRFCIREYPEKTNNICHRVVTKCPFHTFFLEAGTPELTKYFCEVDQFFYAKAFPELNFHRGSSWENTIAYGKDHCEFVFERNK